MSKLKIKKWDPSTLRSDSVILLLGKRGTGKSTLMRDLMYHVKDKLDFGIAMSPTEESSESLGTFLPSSWIYNDFNQGAVEKMMALQRQHWKRGHGSNVFLLLDDCMYDRGIFRGDTGKLFRQLFMNGRHRRIFFLNCQQYAMDMPPDLRSQVDVVFQLRDNILSSRKKTWEQFFGFFDTFQQFSKTLDATTENYECLVYDSKASKSNKIDESVFWYKANPELPEFKVGRQIFWDLHQQYYCDKEEDNELERLMDKTKQAALANKNTRVVKASSDGQTVVAPKSMAWQDNYD